MIIKTIQNGMYCKVGVGLNIVFITMELPYPANSGGRIYTWERLNQIKKYNNNIFLFSLKEKNEVVEYDKLSQICYKVNVYERGSKYLRGIVNFCKPYPVISRYSKEMYEAIQNVIRSNNIDIIIIDIPEMLLNCPMDNNIPKILTQHNIEYEVLKSIAKDSNNIMKKVIFYIEYLKMKKFEHKFYSSGLIDGYVFISEEELVEFKKYFDIKNYVVISQGYDIKNCDVVNKTTDQSEKVIVFTGKMNYQPNIEAVKWFSNEIFRNIKLKIDNVKFYIVGKLPTEEVKALSTEDIIVTGEVESIEPYIKKADLVVIPLKSGGGVKIKLFEALGNGKLVVTTDKGIEGTEFKNNIHVLVANNENDFSEACIRLIGGMEQYSYLVENSIDLIDNLYSWQSLGRKYDDFLLNVVSSKKDN